MAKFKPAKTARRLRNQESNLNAKITICNLALDRLEHAGVSKPNCSVDDTLIPIEKGIYDSTHGKRNTALENRRTVQNALTELGMQTHPAAVDNRK